jgi:hypothetical protein
MSNVHVSVEMVEGEKKVRLQGVDRNVHPWKFTVVEEAPARNHVEIHTRNCDFEHEAKQYFDMLKKG